MQVTMLWAMALVLVGASQGASQTGGQAGGPPGRFANVAHGVVTAIDHVPLPAQEAGVLSKLLVREGSLVKQGQLLAKIDDREARVKLEAAKFRLDVAEAKAKNDAEVRAAMKLIEFYKADYDESIRINTRSSGSIPDTQVRRQLVQWEKSTLDAEVTAMEFDNAKLERNVAQAEVDAAQLGMERRALTAPFDGIIVKLYRQQSEWVQIGEPILRVVRMDALRVEGFVPVREYARHQLQKATVAIVVQLPGGAPTTLLAEMTFVSPEDEASGDFRVYVEVQNPPGRGGYPWLLQPGMEAEMKIELRTGTAPTSP
jgi:multidrug efflux pump subunit AcrA (membrane-fusion protein)